MPKSFLVRTGREVVDDREKETSKFLSNFYYICTIKFTFLKYLLYLNVCFML